MGSILNKKIFILVLLLGLASFADVMPYYVDSLNNNLIGFCKVESPLNIRQEPSENSAITETLDFDYNNSLQCSSGTCSFEKVFSVYSKKNKVAMLSTVDETEGWAKVCYNEINPFCGWIKEDDNNKFYNWRDFYGVLGKKYGLYPFKNIEKKDKILYSSNKYDSNSTGKMLLPKIIFPWLVSGNWILVKAHDYDNSIKTGWINFRDENGKLKYFVKF